MNYSEHPWYFKNVFKAVQKHAKSVSVTVTCLDDIPFLVNALEAYGKFQTAEIFREWYTEMKVQVDNEREIHAPYGNEGYCYCGAFGCTYAETPNT